MRIIHFVMAFIHIHLPQWQFFATSGQISIQTHTTYCICRYINECHWMGIFEQHVKQLDFSLLDNKLLYAAIYDSIYTYTHMCKVIAISRLWNQSCMQIVPSWWYILVITIIWAETLIYGYCNSNNNNGMHVLLGSNGRTIFFYLLFLLIHRLLLHYIDNDIRKERHTARGMPPILKNGKKEILLL